MAWGKAGSTTLSSSGDTLTTSTFTPSTFNMFMVHVLKTGGNARGFGRVGNNTIDTGSNYAYGRSPNGGAKSNFTSQSVLYTPDVEDTSTEFHVGYYLNISGEEKLFIMNIIQDGGSGAGNDPDRAKEVSKWANTSSQINIQQVYNTAGGDLDTNSNITVLGSDITPAAGSSVTVSDGAVFYETDNNKEYVLYNNTWTEV